MAEFVEIGFPPIRLYLRENARARRFGLRISPKDGQLWLTIPKGGRVEDGIQFAESKADWARKHLVKFQSVSDALTFGSEVLVSGVPVKISKGGRRIELSGARLSLPGPEEKIPTQLKAFLKLRAQQILVPASEEYAARIGRKVNGFSFRDTTSRWGSCTSQGRLMYSLRLAMAPERVARYVAAHEVAHLIEMNHGPSFWRLVGDLFPNYQRERDWLKREGHKLHAVRLSP